MPCGRRGVKTRTLGCSSEMRESWRHARFEDRLLPEVNTAMLRGPSQQMLRTLVNELPPQVGKTKSLQSARKGRWFDPQ